VSASSGSQAVSLVLDFLIYGIKQISILAVKELDYSLMNRDYFYCDLLSNVIQDLQPTLIRFMTNNFNSFLCFT